MTGIADHSLLPGEQVAEDFSVAGRQGRVVWTFVERGAPRQWIIEGDVDGRRAAWLCHRIERQFAIDRIRARIGLTGLKRRRTENQRIAAHRRALRGFWIRRQR